ncbi:amino acid ABC transporter permease [Rhizobium sp. TRM95796]|uniref:amino acid ABC transporter permease n=1 Tax=Rhizobium sp. TRM95796 TaxID=2979862 RepID=UPI0021E90EF3|nr:amino acid ABC transporter permease [Rhizobium sp. TRM95796]MCV3768547.1 amino acid ABC transporter permease [Rhizobium sp. TRM95796]
MAADAATRVADDRPSQSLLYNPEVRGYVYQAVTVIVVIAFIYTAVTNAAENLARANMTAGFDFLGNRAGFDVGQSLIAYTSDSTYFRALLVGLVNTLVVAFFGIITASILGLLVGVGRLSHNWLIARLCTVYVEFFRNIPPLLVIFFWYKLVLDILPGVKESFELPFSVYLNNRGVFMPAPMFGDGSSLIIVALLLGIALAFGFSRWAKAKQMATGKQYPTITIGLASVIGLPLLAFIALGAPLSFDTPVLGKFNLNGGMVVGPEFLSLYLALSFYTASFIAEIVRAGIRGVPKGQSEAAEALGIRHGLTTRLVVLPQALRIIIPPLTSQYLNLTKNSSLAIAVGYADLVAVGGTILNQSGRSIEIIAIWMVMYVSISLITSLFMNWFNAKMALVER